MSGFIFPLISNFIFKFSSTLSTSPSRLICQAQEVSTPLLFSTHTQMHTDTHSEKIKKQHVSKRQCISPQRTEPRQRETEKNKTKQNSRRRPPSSHPLPPSYSTLKPWRLSVRFFAFVPGYSTFFELFSLQCNDKTYKTKLVSGKGRLHSERQCYNYSGTVRQSGVCISRLPRYTQSDQYLKYSMYNMNKHKQQGHTSLCKCTTTYKQQFIQYDNEVCGSACDKLRRYPPGILILRMGELCTRMHMMQILETNVFFPSKRRWSWEKRKDMSSNLNIVCKDVFSTFCSACSHHRFRWNLQFPLAQYQ